MFWKYATNLQENTLQHGCSPICCIFSEHLILRTPLEGCFYIEDYLIFAIRNKLFFHENTTYFWKYFQRNKFSTGFSNFNLKKSTLLYWIYDKICERHYTNAHVNEIINLPRRTWSEYYLRHADKLYTKSFKFLSNMKPEESVKVTRELCRCYNWGIGNSILIYEFIYGQGWWIWPSQLSFSFYST